MDKHQRHDQRRKRDLASPGPAQAEHAAATPTPVAGGSHEAKDNPAKAGSHEEIAAPADRRGQEPPAPQGPQQARQPQGDYASLPDDLDGMHNDSWVPGVQAAGSPEEAAAAAREAARREGGHADELFANAPGVEGPAPNVPSSLNMDRHASAAETGRAGMEERLRRNTASSPAVTGGDVDADWESAYGVGDEAPGGGNPTPDQDIVDEVGKALGVEYEDTEELKGAEKIASRDRHRWELDPASSEDYQDRTREDKAKR